MRLRNPWKIFVFVLVTVHLAIACQRNTEGERISDESAQALPAEQTVHNESDDEAAAGVDRQGRRPAGRDYDDHQLRVTDRSEVLVRADAGLFVRPDRESTRFQITDDVDNSQLWKKNLFFRFRLIADHGEWVEVSTFGADPIREEGCDYLQPVDTRDVELKFFVRRWDLVEMLTQPVDRAFDDGTQYSLAPGLAVRSTDEDEHYRVQVGPVLLDVELPEEAVGVVTEPRPPLRGERLSSVIAWQTELRLDGEIVELDPLAGTNRSSPGSGVDDDRWLPPVVRVSDYPSTSTVYDHLGTRRNLLNDRTIKDSEPFDLVTLTRPCGQLRLRVESKWISDLELMSETEMLGALGAMDDTPVVTIDKGTAVYDSGGVEIGRITASNMEIDVPRFQSGELFCQPMELGSGLPFSELLASEEARILRFCIRYDDVEIGSASGSSSYGAGSLLGDQGVLYETYGEGQPTRIQALMVQCHRQEVSACIDLDNRCEGGDSAACQFVSAMSDRLVDHCEHRLPNACEAKREWNSSRE